MSIKENIIKNKNIIIILVLSLLSRFLFLGYPSEVVFDEVHFGKYITSYFNNSYYFDNHPPLAKIIVFAFGEIAGYKPGFDYKQIGEASDTRNLLIMRFIPALLGMFFPLILYFLIKKIGVSDKMAFFGALLAVFDNAILAQSKFILMDIFLLFFGFLGLYFYLLYRNGQSKKIWLLILAALFVAFSLSVKWTGLQFLGLIGLAELVQIIKKLDFKKAVFDALILLLLPFLVYYCVFLVHFGILYKSGTGDAFMTQAFNNHSLSNFQKFTELNNTIYWSQKNTTATHAYGSKWYQWPFDSRPIWYWQKVTGTIHANIWFIGNIVVWYLVLFGVVFSFYVLAIKKLRQKMPWFFWYLLIGWFANLLPNLDITRVMFLYHYLPSLIFGILIVACLFDRIFLPALTQESAKYLYWGTLALVFLCFLLLLPITYGIPVSEGWNNFYNGILHVFL